MCETLSLEKPAANHSEMDCNLLKERVTMLQQQLVDETSKLQQQLTLSQKTNASQESTICMLKNRLKKRECQRIHHQEKQVS